MPFVTGYQRVRVWVPPPVPELPGGGTPPWGLPEFPEGPWEPGRPEFPWVPDEPGPGQPLPPGVGLPGRPGQPLPRPPRNYPIVPGGGDMPDHPILPDLNDGGHWGKVYDPRPKTGGGQAFPAYVTNPEPPQVEDDYEAKHPKTGLPGSWVTVVYRDALTWAWCPDPPTTEPEPERR